MKSITYKYNHARLQTEPKPQPKSSSIPFSFYLHAGCSHLCLGDDSADDLRRWNLLLQCRFRSMHCLPIWMPGVLRWELVQCMRWRVCAGFQYGAVWGLSWKLYWMCWESDMPHVHDWRYSDERSLRELSYWMPDLQCRSNLHKLWLEVLLDSFFELWPLPRRLFAV